MTQSPVLIPEILDDLAERIVQAVHPRRIVIQNPAVRLDHAKREIVAARFFEILAEAVVAAGNRQEKQA